MLPKTVLATPNPVFGAPEPDGVTYAILRRVDGRAVVYDKIDYLKARCDARTSAQVASEPDSNRICFRNQNSLLRQAQLAPRAQIVAISEGGEASELTAASLAHYEQCCSGLEIWQITLRSGSIIRMYQFNVAGN